jgi:hypothetical protein
LHKNRTLPILALDRQCIRCCAVPSSALGQPALMHGISPGGVVRSLVGAASEQKTTIPAFRDRTPIAGPHWRIVKKSGPRRRRLKNSASTYADRTLPINRNDSGGTDPTRSSRSADLAFQRAMRCATARGLEHPPMIGVVKDIRPLNTPRLFEPVPHSSGCTSPALECAELVPHNDCVGGGAGSPIKVTPA